MLVEMAIGDAYGAAFEFITPIHAQVVGLINDGATHQKHPDFDIGMGRYTDDTQMAVAIALEMKEGHVLSRKGLADRFVETFKRDERLGYANKFYDFLKEVNSGAEFLDRIRPNSTKSGAAMRAGPTGLFREVTEVLEQAKIQAKVTHNTSEAILAAQAVALMTNFFVFQRQTADETKMVSNTWVADWVQHHLPDYDWSKDWEGWVDGSAISCAHAAITAVKNGTSYQDVLKRSIAMTGDVDTVAAIAMFATSLTDLPNDLPQSLYDGLEDGEYGKRYLYALDGQLKAFARSEGAMLV